MEAISRTTTVTLALGTLMVPVRRLAQQRPNALRTIRAAKWVSATAVSTPENIATPTLSVAQDTIA